MAQSFDAPTTSNEHTMMQPPIETVCDGILDVRANAEALLADARLLRSQQRYSSSLALAYTACEELGKLPILVGAATRLVLGEDVQWKSTLKRFRNHTSKAVQFLSFNLFQHVFSARSGALTMDQLVETVMSSPDDPETAFSQRNASLYVDFSEGKFRRPADAVSASDANEYIKMAEFQLSFAHKLFGTSQAEVLDRIRSNADPVRRQDLAERADKWLSEQDD